MRVIKMNPDQAFEILGLDKENSSADEINKAFRKLGIKYHPDVNKDPDAEKKFKEINEAKTVALDFLENPGKYNPQFPGFNGFDFSGFNPFADLFNHSNFQRQREVHNVSIAETITFEESILGCDKEIEFRRDVKCTVCNGEAGKKKSNGCKDCNGFGQKTVRQGNMTFAAPCQTCRGRNVKFDNCTNCNGKGVKPELKKLNIKIPAGIETGNILSLNQAGNFAQTSPMGDFYSNVHIHLSVKPHATFKKVDNDVVTSMNISLLDALKGLKINVPTVYGDKELNIFKNVKNKDLISIKNCGVKNKGDHVVEINIDYPKDTESLIELLEKSK